LVSFPLSSNEVTDVVLFYYVGIDSIAMDMKEKKLTVIGDIDPVDVVSKLRKIWHTEILAVGPAKEEKKEGGKKDEGKKEGEIKNPNEQQMTELMTLNKDYYNNNPYPSQYGYRAVCVEENPNACAIC
jgi:hypothetical protein